MRKRFTTRTLLLTTAAFAVWLAIAVHNAARERTALTVIMTHKGAWTFDWHYSERVHRLGISLEHGIQEHSPEKELAAITRATGSRPDGMHKILGDILGPEYSQHVVSVAIPTITSGTAARVSAPELAAIAELPKLQHLTLRIEQSTAEHFVVLKRSDSISSLTLWNMELDSDKLVILSELRSLQQLNLISCNVSEEQLRAFRDRRPNCGIRLNEHATSAVNTEEWIRSEFERLTGKRARRSFDLFEIERALNRRGLLQDLPEAKETRSSLCKIVHARHVATTELLELVDRALELVNSRGAGRGPIKHPLVKQVERFKKKKRRKRGPTCQICHKRLANDHVRYKSSLACASCYDKHVNGPAPPRDPTDTPRGSLDRV